LVPPAGIENTRLVSPGAMLPVSIDASFSTTRCTMLSMFLNTTSCPPTVAGFGSNDCAPFWRTMVIVTAFGLGDGDGDGDVGAGLEDPPHPHAPTATAPTTNLNN
jgi:hypothetical protein